jgi:transcriptional regulator with XRE-family HTH domain
MVLLRHLLGDALRRLRLRQGRTLREVSATARVSLGYLSEVERGRKEASSELLASICDALGAPLSQVLREVSDGFALAELQNEPAFEVPREPALAGPVSAERPGAKSAPADATASLRGAVRLQQPAKAPAAPQRMVMPQRKISVATAQRLSPAEPKLEPVTLPGTEDFDKLGRGVNDMVPV